MMEDPQRIRRMSQSATRLAPTNAARRVVETMEKYTSNERRG
jgi:hypothetical protein